MEEGIDLGQDVVGKVRERLGRRSHRIADWERGFTWRPNGVTQHVWSERPVRREPARRWRVQVRSRLLKRFDGSWSQLEALRTELSHGTVGAIVRSAGDRSRLQFATTFHVHDGNAQAAPHLVALVAHLHAAAVRRLARSEPLASTGAVPEVAAAATVCEPISYGDDMTTGAALRSANAGPPSMTLALEALRALEGVRAVPTAPGLQASVPCLLGHVGLSRALLEVDPAASDDVGPGMRVVLSLPGYADPLSAVTLNEEELSNHSCTDVLGCWWAVDHVLRHVSFIPMALCTADLMASLVVQAPARASWACARVSGRDIGAEPPPGRILKFPGSG